MSFSNCAKLLLTFLFIYIMLSSRDGRHCFPSLAPGRPPGKKSAERGVRSTTPGLTHNIGDNNVRG